MFVFVPELFKCNSKLLWRLGSLNGLREAVPKQCSMEEKTVLVACGAYFGKGYLEWFDLIRVRQTSVKFTGHSSCNILAWSGQGTFDILTRAQLPGHIY